MYKVDIKRWRLDEKAEQRQSSPESGDKIRKKKGYKQEQWLTKLKIINYFSDNICKRNNNERSAICHGPYLPSMPKKTI